MAILIPMVSVGTIPNSSTTHAQPAANDAQYTQFTASPTSGVAPLTVRFCASAGISLDFGDGSGSGMGVPLNGDCPPGLSTYVSHTYTVPGTYHLRGLPCPSSMLHPECGQAAAQAGLVTIAVTGAP